MNRPFSWELMFFAVCATAALGVTAGAILADGFWFFGCIAGLYYALPAGLLVGLYGMLRRWSLPAVLVPCVGQFIGALVTGFTLAHITNAGPPDHALEGQIAGLVAGLVVGEALHRRTQRGVNRRSQDPPRASPGNEDSAYRWP